MRGSQMAPGGFSFDVTELTRKVLIALVALYVVQLLLIEWLGLPLYQYLGWWWQPAGAFYPWQIGTAYLLNGPGPLAAFFDWLAIFFFLGPVERAIGRKGLLRAMALTVAVSAVLGFIMLATGAVTARGVFIGLNPMITALIVVFGLTNPNANILLFFVLPIKAAWIAWGSGLFALLNFLAYRDLNSALWLTGWIGGWLFMESTRRGGLKGMLPQRMASSERTKNRKKDPRRQAAERGLEIIEGGGEPPQNGTSSSPGWWNSKDEDDGGPIVH